MGWRGRRGEGAIGSDGCDGSDDARRMYTDSAIFDPGALRLLTDVMGPDRVMLGTDAPFPLGEQEPGALVRHSSFLDDAAKAKILAGNALAFFGL